MSKIIIELNGIPGSGKTTYTEIIKPKLNGSLSVKYLDDVYFYKEIGLISKFIQYFRVLFSARFYKLYKACSKGIKDFNLTKDSLFDMLRYLKLERNLINFYYAEDFDILFLEEGLVQYYLSIPYKKEIILGSEFSSFILNESTQIKSEIKIINLNITSEESNIRIKSRRKGNKLYEFRRIDNLSEEERTNTLSTNIKNINILRAQFTHTLDVEVDDSAQVNLKDILSFISCKGDKCNEK